MLLSFIFDGTRRVDRNSFKWFKVKTFRHPKIKFDVISLPSNAVAVMRAPNVGQNTFEFAVVEEFPTYQCLDLIFTFERDVQITKDMVESVKQYIDSFDPIGRRLHIVERNFTQTASRNHTIILRVFKNSDFHCTEHPEMWYGLTKEMYQCQACLTYVRAGQPHPTKEEMETPFVPDPEDEAEKE